MDQKCTKKKNYPFTPNPTFYLTIKQGKRFLKKKKDIGSLNVAIQIFKEALTFEPTSSLFHLLGRALFYKGKITEHPHHWQEAIKQYEKAEMRATSDRELRAIRWDKGRLLLHLGKKEREPDLLKEAIACYQEFPPSSRTHSAVWSDYGDALCTLGSWLSSSVWIQSGIQKYESAGNTSSYHISSRIARGSYLLYTITHRSEDYQIANQRYQRAIQQHPHKKKLWKEAISMTLERGQWHNSRESLCQAIHDACQMPDKQKGHAILSLKIQALAKLGEIDQNLSLIKEAERELSNLRVSSSPLHALTEGWVMMALANYFSDHNQYYGASQSFQQALSSSLCQSNIWLMMGLSHHKAGLLDHQPESQKMAIRFLQKGINIKASPHLFIAYAQAVLAGGESTSCYLNEALLALKQGEAMTQSTRNQRRYRFLKGLVLFRLGEEADEEGQVLESIDYLKEILPWSSDFPEIHYRYALSIMHMAINCQDAAAISTACLHFAQSVKQGIHTGEALMEWGIALMHQMEIEKKDRLEQTAERLLKMAIREGESRAQYYLGCLYCTTGKIGKALTA
ncbi:MAG: tetratricopeptide repeat protein, partial [Chlamydiota bacterium]|nr:tetratricopeptide repeat protein [Chlamydiota bacterium]